MVLSSPLQDVEPDFYAHTRTCTTRPSELGWRERAERETERGDSARKNNVDQRCRKKNTCKMNGKNSSHISLEKDRAEEAERVRGRLHARYRKTHQEDVASRLWQVRMVHGLPGPPKTQRAQSLHHQWSVMRRRFAQRHSDHPVQRYRRRHRTDRG
jgi:hypothetical protein